MRGGDLDGSPDAHDLITTDDAAAASILLALGGGDTGAARADERRLDAVLASVAATHGVERVTLPRIALELPRAASLTELVDSWPTVPEDLFPRWKVADVAAVFVAGLAGAFTSAALQKDYGDLHDETFARQHAGETIDKVPGQMSGGFFHRLKHGHDVLLPMEVDWPNYAPAKGLDGFARAAWPWLRHLLQDTFSREGLPGPGTGYFRDFILEHADHESYRELLTVKARDITGAALTTAIVEVYSQVSSQIADGRAEDRRGYRHVTLTFAAHMIAAITGLLVPNPSLNGASLLCAAKALFGIVRVGRYIDAILAERSVMLGRRGAGLSRNDDELHRVSDGLDGEGRRLAEFGARLAEAQRRMHAVPLDVAPLVRLLDEDARLANRLLLSF